MVPSIRLAVSRALSTRELALTKLEVDNLPRLRVFAGKLPLDLALKRVLP